MNAAVTLPAPPESILDLPDGLHAGFPDALYHQRTRGIASKHLLDLVAETPAHAAAWLAGSASDDEENEALRFGKMFHCAVLEPERFDRDYLTRPKWGDCRRKENKASRDAWLREHVPAAELDAVMADKDDRDAWIAANTVKQEELAQFRAMAQRVRTHPKVLAHLYRGQKELTVKWTDPATGVLCKGRSDLYDARDGVLLDLKTCRKASKEEVSKSITNYRYYVQDPWYCGGFRHVGADLRERDPFLFVFGEKDPPYEVAVWALEPEAVEHGRKVARRNLETFARCLETDEWPGYPAEVRRVSLKPWAFT